MMFTTELSHRVFLTVLLLLLGVIGKRPDQVLAGTTKTTEVVVLGTSQDNDKTRESDDNEQSLFKSILYSNPNSFYNNNNYYNQNHNHDPDDLRSSSKSNRRRNPSSSSIMIKANLPFTTTTNDFNNINNNNNDYTKTKKFSQRNGLVVNTPYANNGNFFDCFFGKNCLIEDKEDEWRNYYSVLNGLDKPGLNDRYSQQLPFGTSNDQFQTGISATIPFIVDAGIGTSSNINNNHNNKEKDEFHSHNTKGDNKVFSSYGRYSSPNLPSLTPPHIRLSRTTTSSPSWVKLQPLPAHMYDPFTSNRSKSDGSIISKNSERGSSKFASRIGGSDGEEMSPETFAERYGWNRDSQQTLRLPAWLEELNHQHGFRGQGQESQNNPGQGPPSGSSPGDDSKGWVKLDPIPVSGVTISKWVPKGTSPAELPSTNWPVRDKPNAWWDRIDIGLSKPEPSWQDGPIRSPLHSSPSSSSSWGAHRYPLNNNKKHHGMSQSQTLSDAWSDVIYPDTPSSATASWEATKGISSPSSSFPSSWLSKVGSGDKYSGRPAVASWSAPGAISGSNYNNRLSTSRFGNQRPSFGRPSFYPDPQAGPNDPRWKLVSTTGETSVKKPPYKINNHDRFSDFPYDYYSHRHSKDMNLTKLLLSSTTTAPSTILTQEELFRRTNATLNSLSPVLLHRNGYLRTTDKPEPFQTFIPILEGDMADVVLDTSHGVAADSPRSSNQIVTRQGENKKSFFKGINPVFAAVGAGMIPAAMAAVLPVAIGKRRKRNAVQNIGRFGNVLSRHYRAVPRLILRTPHYDSPMLLSSYAPNLYKFLKKPAMKNNAYNV